MRILNPYGSVVAVTGAWGSGKSSAINLVLHHLESCGDDARQATIRFEPWRYRSEDALAFAILRELRIGLKPALSKSRGAQEAMARLAARVSTTGPMIGSAIGMIAEAPAGQFAEGVLAVLGDILPDDGSDEALQGIIADSLATSDRRFLVVIDDIDRLAPDEALTVFRLIKSVGRLPNVI